MQKDFAPISHQKVAQAVAAFAGYSDEIEALISDLARGGRRIGDNEISSVLNGQTTLALQRLVPKNLRRESGIFFTSVELAGKVADHLALVPGKGVKIVDPACGAGNLLLACAKHLPVGDNLQDTLIIWSDCIYGYDLHYEFVRAARLRLMLLAASMHNDRDNCLARLQSNQFFSGLKVGNVFRHLPMSEKSCVVVNPPFGHMQAPEDCRWATGRIQTAGWFLERILQAAPAGQHVVAILPDVLRSGTRYGKWRDFVSTVCVSLAVELSGQFDESTDVDVFILHAVTGDGSSIRPEWPTLSSPIGNGQHVVSDFFDVHVGPVVPHRDPLCGPSYPYIHARTAPAWQILDHIVEERSYAGTVYSPPFVVVHRTSSPREKHRCVATIVNEKRDIAVENHLLVLLPRDKSLESCEQLLQVLKLTQSSEWLNSRIRCRHLTVSSMCELPCCDIAHGSK